MVPYIHTVDGLSVVLDGTPYNVSRTDPLHDVILDLIESDASEDSIYQALNRVKQQIEAEVELSEFLSFKDGVVYYMGEEIHGYAVSKLVELVEGGHNITSLSNFLERLQNNPSSQTIDDLYTFLEYGHMPITEDGKFLAYKVVNSEYRDKHSNSIDNSIGAYVSMDRKKVDDRREVTCSHGLHACSFEYVKSFVSSGSDHVIVVEIDPADVVSIPTDYNNTKMRVCGYKVIGEVGEYHKEPEKDVLADSDFYFDDGFDGSDDQYQVEVRAEDGSAWFLDSTFDDRFDAENEADWLFEEGSSVRVSKAGIVLLIKHQG